MRPTKGQSDDRPRAGTAPARLVLPPRSARPRRRPTTCARVLATIPATTPTTLRPLRPSTRLHAAGRRRGPGRRWRAGRRFRDHATRGRRSRPCRTSRSSSRADLRHPRRRRRRRTSGLVVRSPSFGSSTRAAAVTSATCRARAPVCRSSERTGTEPTRSSPMGDTNQVAPVWSPDGTRLLYFDEGKLYLIDPSGGGPQPVDTGCAAPCMSDSQLAFSSDGARARLHPGVRRACSSEYRPHDGRHDGPRERSGRRTALDRFGRECGSRLVPRWDPDRLLPVRREGRWRSRSPPRLDAIWVVDADGNELRQLSPTTLAAAIPRMVPGRRPHPVRVDRRGAAGHLHDAARRDRRASPDHRRGLGLGRLDAGRADPVRSARRCLGGLVDDERRWHRCRPPHRGRRGRSGGRASRHASVRRGSRSAARRSCRRRGRLRPRSRSGRPRRRRSRRRCRTLAPGFAWTGSMSTDEGGPLGESATLLGDGRVLFAGGCSTAAELYDPATGTFTPTGDMTAVACGVGRDAAARRPRPVHRRLQLCGRPARMASGPSAELYDPATGTFSPTGSMGTPREFQTATRLADGRVLIAGGYHGRKPERGHGDHPRLVSTGGVRGQRAQDRRAVRPGDRHVQPDRVDELHSRSAHRHVAPGRPGARGRRRRRGLRQPEDGGPL